MEDFLLQNEIIVNFDLLVYITLLFVSQTLQKQCVSEINRYKTV